MVFVALHIGAGCHSLPKRSQYQKICTNACEAAIKVLKNDSMTAIDGAVEAIVHLENSRMTNAGFGSNLNTAGYVECDASLMDGSDYLFGSVGAIRSIKNPIKVAKLLLEKQRTSMPLGLIAPSFLAGEGARKFAIQNGLQENDLISEYSVSQYKKYKRRLDKFHEQEQSEHYINYKNQRLDTVGAVCLDKNGFLSTAVSSGGLALKQEGRVGQASVIGAGCWTQNNIAVTTTGIGEYLVRTSFARKIVDCLSDSIDDSQPTLQQIVKIFDNHFFGSPLMKNVPRDHHTAGILGLIIDPDSTNLELFYAHSSETMCIGYMNDSLSSAKSFVSELDPMTKPGMSLKAQSEFFQI